MKPCTCRCVYLYKSTESNYAHRKLVVHVHVQCECSLVPRSLATLKAWEWPEDKATVILYVHSILNYAKQKLNDEVGMAMPKSTLARFVRIFTSTMYMSSLRFDYHASINIDLYVLSCECS